MGMHSNSISKRVLDFLRKNAPHTYNARTVYRCLYPKNKIIDKKKITAVKVALSRLVKNGKIRRVTKGFYQAKIDFALIHQLENPLPHFMV